MSFLVTGATSGLGRNATEYLTARRERVLATGRNENAGQELSALGAQFRALDLAHAGPDQLANLVRGTQCIWHCAALSSPWGREEDFFAANVRATVNLANAAIEAGVARFVHVSTPSIYFDYRHRYDIPETFRPARSVNAYARTKALAEDEILRLARAQHRTHFVILRPRGLFGPHDRAILPRVFRLWKARGGVLPLPGGGRARCDLTFTGNVVHALWCATHAQGIVSGEAYNITNQQPMPLAGVLTRLFERLELPLTIRPVPWPLLDGMARVLECTGRLTSKEPVLTRYGVGALNFAMTLDNRKAQSSLGYFPPCDIEEGIARTARWIHDNGPHYTL